MSANFEMMEHIAAFCDGLRGGNPAGVLVGSELPSNQLMQEIAKHLGYSETVFAAPLENAWAVRYFSPATEIPFCGHATIALGACLARREGPGEFKLKLRNGDIEVTGDSRGKLGWASFVSPPSHSVPVPADQWDEAMTLFRLKQNDIGDLPPALIDAGARHIFIPVVSRKLLAGMRYDFASGRELMQRFGWVTAMLCYEESAEMFHVRNAFAYGGLVEDPATGAAAAALAGYLRTLGYPPGQEIVVNQGEDMGVPCRLIATIPQVEGGRVQVAGYARSIAGPLGLHSWGE